MRQCKQIQELLSTLRAVASRSIIYVLIVSSLLMTFAVSPTPIATALPADSVMLAQTSLPSQTSKPDEAIVKDVDGVTLIHEYISKTRGGSLSSLFTIFFLTIGPLKIVPVFLNLTANADDTLRKKMAFRGFWISTLVIMFISFAGIGMVDQYGIPISALIMAAGIVLFLVSLQVIMAQYSSAAPPSPPPQNPSLDLVVTPLVFPAILTPYGIGIVLMIMSIVTKVTGDQTTILGLLMVIMVLNLLSMLYARQIIKVLNPSILRVLALVLGMVQLSLGISWIFTAIRMEALVIRAMLAS